MGIVIRRPDLELKSELKDGLLAAMHRALRTLPTIVTRIGH